ncbi:MAG: lactate racemase domain-containing protein [Desulfobacterales bacterium]|nr:lactate racemase domain-containing protein [Desulfobacterales bacterium]
MEHAIHYGEERLTFSMPPGWELLPQSLPPEKEVSDLSVSELTRKALMNPSGGTPIGDVLAVGKRVAILSDDGTRPTPVREMMPPLLEELMRGGIRREDIDIVIGLGTHVAMEEEALTKKFGKEIMNTYRIYQHDSRAEDLVPVGRLKTGAEVRINPIVARADIRIGMGSIFPHPMNGFGGGPKIIFPAVSNYDAIREHHLAHTVHPKSIFGNTESNPFYGEAFRVAQLADLNYSLNCIYDTVIRPREILFGSFESVHKQGSVLSKDLCGMTFSKKSDITLISAYPHMEPFQIFKSLNVGCLITKKGGTVILLAKTEEEMPLNFVEIFEKIQKASQGNLRDYVVKKFKSNQLLLEGAAVDFNCALFFSNFLKHEYRVVIVSKELGDDNLERMRFVHYQDLEKAIEAESRRQPNGTVNLSPLGGILPILPEGLDMGY